MNEHVWSPSEESEARSGIEQLVDFWMGRRTYDSDREWLDNVGAAIGELCDLIGHGEGSFVANAPLEGTSTSGPFTTKENPQESTPKNGEPR